MHGHEKERECWGQKTFLCAGSSAPDLRRLKDNLRKISRMRREHMQTARMKVAAGRAKTAAKEDERNRKTEERRVCLRVTKQQDRR